MVPSNGVMNVYNASPKLKLKISANSSNKTFFRFPRYNDKSVVVFRVKDHLTISQQCKSQRNLRESVTRVDQDKSIT